MERSDEEILRNSLPFARTNRAMMEGSHPRPSGWGSISLSIAILRTHACALHGGSDKIEAIRIRDCVPSGEVTNRN